MAEIVTGIVIIIVGVTEGEEEEEEEADTDLHLPTIRDLAEGMRDTIDQDPDLIRRVTKEPQFVLQVPQEKDISTDCFIIYFYHSVYGYLYIRFHSFYY